MSWQSFLLNFAMRLTKWRYGKVTSPAEAVAVMRKSTQNNPGKVPSSVEVTELTANGVPCEWIEAPEAKGSEQVMLYLHGGGYICCGLNTHRDVAWRLSAATGRRVLSADYGLAPEHPYPAAHNDALACYQWLLEQGFSGDQIVVAGDSAGGNLALSTLMNIRDRELPRPLAGCLFSPWIDLSHSRPAVINNASSEPLLTKEILHFAGQLYAGEIPLDDPRISPLFGNYRDLPPLYINAGSIEILVDDARECAQRAKDAGVEVELNVWKNQAHAFTVLAQFIPEGRESILETAEFLKRLG